MAISAIVERRSGRRIRLSRFQGIHFGLELQNTFLKEFESVLGGENFVHTPPFNLLIHPPILLLISVCTAASSEDASSGNCISTVPRRICTAPGNLIASVAGSVPMLVMNACRACNTAIREGVAAVTIGLGVDIRSPWRLKGLVRSPQQEVEG
jgi:hypothetical protein